jgi:hypothetical protein
MKPPRLSRYEQARLRAHVGVLREEIGRLTGRRAELRKAVRRLTRPRRRAA